MDEKQSRPASSQPFWTRWGHSWSRGWALSPPSSHDSCRCLFLTPELHTIMHYCRTGSGRIGIILPDPDLFQFQPKKIELSFFPENSWYCPKTENFYRSNLHRDSLEVSSQGRLQRSASDFMVVGGIIGRCCEWKNKFRFSSICKTCCKISIKMESRFQIKTMPTHDTAIV